MVEQLEATSKDGTKVPYFVVHRKDMPYDGSNPTLLTAYGGFQISRRRTTGVTGNCGWSMEACLCWPISGGRRWVVGVIPITTVENLSSGKNDPIGSSRKSGRWLSSLRVVACKAPFLALL